MTREVHSKEIDEDQPVVGQEQPAVEEPPAPDAGARESRQKVTPAGVPSAAAPTPPSARLAASIQRMPPAGRWTLGLALAFLSGFAFVLLSSIGSYNDLLPVAFVVTFGLTLAAGFVLSSWWALLALAIATTAGIWVGNWVFVQMAPAGAIEGLSGMTAVLVGFLFSLIVLVPLILLLLAGVGLGKQHGIALGQPHTLSAGEARVSRWIAAFAPVIAGGFLTFMLNNMPGILAMQAIPGVSILVLATCAMSRTMRSPTQSARIRGTF
jgi:hypothetical protein